IAARRITAPRAPRAPAARPALAPAKGSKASVLEASRPQNLPPTPLSGPPWPSMDLPGRLRSTTLGDLLGALHRAGSTGTVELTEDQGRLPRVSLAQGLGHGGGARRSHALARRDPPGRPRRRRGRSAPLAPARDGLAAPSRRSARRRLSPVARGRGQRAPPSGGGASRG